MGLTIHRVEQRGGSLLFQAEITKTTDYKLLQALFRDCISSRLSIDSSFGVDVDLREKKALKYPLNTVFDLIYNAEIGQVGITWKETK